MILDASIFCRRRAEAERYLAALVLAAPAECLTVLRSFGASADVMGEPDYSAILAGVLAMRSGTRIDAMCAAARSLAAGRMWSNAGRALQGPMWTARGLLAFTNWFNPHGGKWGRRVAATTVRMQWPIVAENSLRWREAERCMEAAERMLA